MTVTSHEPLHSIERFDTLFYEHQRGVLAHLRRILKYDSNLVEEVAQETWLKVWRALNKPDGGPSETSFSWVCRIASNAATDALRKTYKIGAHHRDPRPPVYSLERNWAIMEAIIDESEDALSPEQIAIRHEMIEERYRQIPAKYLPIVQMRVSGMTRRDIATLTGASENIIRTALDRRPCRPRGRMHKD